MFVPQAVGRTEGLDETGLDLDQAFEDPSVEGLRKYQGTPELNAFPRIGVYFYDFNTSSTGPCCLLSTAATAGDTWHHGDILYGDITVLYKFGKWSIGPVGYFEVQTTNDNVTGPTGAATCATFCGNYSNVAVGGLVGYDFGPVDIQVWVTDVVEAQNTPAGVGAVFVWSRLGFKLWSPEAPKPLVAKN